MQYFQQFTQTIKEIYSSLFQVGKYGYGVFVAIGLLFINLAAHEQEYDARIDVTFIKTDSSETRYISIINYSNQPIELDVETDECFFFDDSKIISVKESSLTLGNWSPEGYSHLKTFGGCLEFSTFSKLVIDPFTALIIPIKELKSNCKDDIYFALIVPQNTSITLNYKKEKYGYRCKRYISFRRTFHGFTYKPAVYTMLKIIPFGINVNSILTANSGFSHAINKTTVMGLREYLSYFCE